MSPVELAKVKKQLDKYLSKGWIWPNTPLYGDPILFIREKDGTLRICIDYRALNKQTRPDKYPFPRIDDQLDQLVNAYYFNSIILYIGYY